MSQINGIRSGCKDVFRAFLVQNAIFEGELEIPCIESQFQIPCKLIPFSKAISSTEYDAWVHFYEDDVEFERLWNNPQRYLPILRKYKGVITPDYSIYRDMPLVMQYWNIYRGRALGCWMQQNGTNVFPNVRCGDARTFLACCSGVPHNSIIAIGTHGCLKVIEDRKLFIEGLEYIISNLNPRVIVVYGTAPDYIFFKYKLAGIQIVQFDSECMVAHRKKVRV